MTFDPSKPVRQKNGREAVILDTTLGGDFPLAVKLKVDNRWFVDMFCADGRRCKSGFTDCDLINIPEERTVEVWLNCYPSGRNLVIGYESREYADRVAADTRHACIKRTITYTVGEGLG